jgi:hypothetical protein
LHSSGIYRHAFTKQAQTKYIVGDDDRVLFRWNEPREFHQDARLLLEVIIPTHELTVPAEEPSPDDKTKILLVEPAPSGAAVVVSLAVTNPGLEVDGHPRPAGGVASCVLRSWLLPDERRLWVVVSHQPLDDAFWALVADARAQMTTHMQKSATQPTRGHLRAAVWTYSEELGLVRFIDLSGEFLPRRGAA